MKARILLVAAAIGVAAPSVAGPKAVASSDTTVDLAGYHSFGFEDPLGTDQNGYQTIVSQGLKSATRHQLEARGLVYNSETPDLVVNFNARLDDKMRVTTTPAPMSMTMGRGYYGYRGGLYSTWPMYQDQTSVTPYKEGTLNIDIVDAAKKRLVWEAVVTDTMTSKKRDRIAETLDKAVETAFKKYPVPARK